MTHLLPYAALTAALSISFSASALAQDTPALEDTNRVEPSAAAAHSGIAAPYLRIGWRVMGLADHVSHGPEVAAGVLLWNHLELGIGGFARPGPINPATFQADLGGGSYRGQDELTLRSDGALIGLLVGFRFQFPGVNWLDVEVPVIVGLGAFGFYLHGDDRDTPDGRRVSEWENELFDGRDSSAGLGVDVGLRLAIHTPLPWLNVSAGVHYTHVVGYDSLLASDYGGFSGSLGVEMSMFR